MSRSITIYTGQKDHAWIKAALETLANDIISNEEAGQRGQKLSKLFNAIASAYVADRKRTTELMQEIKKL